MLRTLDRYVLREAITPFLLALLMLTFALEIPPILDHGEKLIAQGASWYVVVRVLATADAVLLPTLAERSRLYQVFTDARKRLEASAAV